MKQQWLYIRTNINITLLNKRDIIDLFNWLNKFTYCVSAIQKRIAKIERQQILDKIIYNIADLFPSQDSKMQYFKISNRGLIDILKEF